MKTPTQMLATFIFIIALVLIAPYTYALDTDTTQVSVNTSGVQATNNSFLPALNENGQFVAFHSFASNLVAFDTNGARDVFVRNRLTGQTTRASVATGGIQANGLSRFGDLSHDGNLVSFESEATNLVAGDTNLRTDIFVHDRGGITTTRVSVVTGGGQSNGDSFSARLSGDGNLVVFESGGHQLGFGAARYQWSQRYFRT